MFYEHYKANVIYDPQLFTHQLPSDLPLDFKPYQACGAPRESYYPNCGFDTAGKMLSHVLVNMTGSTISQLNPKDDDWQSKGILREFEQDEFHDRTLFQNANFGN